MHKNLFLILLLSIVINGGLYAQAEHVCDVLFLNAVIESNMPEARIHLGHNWSNINVQQPGNEKTALMYAIEANDLTMVNWLLNAPSDIPINLNLEDLDGKTALIYAVEGGNLVILHALLEHGTLTINHQPKGDKRKRTALYLAVEKDSYDMVKMLLDRKADPNLMAARSKGINPFMLAIQKGYTSMIPLFANAGLDITQKHTPTITLNDVFISIMISPLHATLKYTRTTPPPLLWALRNTIPADMILVLLENFPNAMESRDDNGKTPLEYLELNRKYSENDYRRIKSKMEEQGRG